MSAKTIALARKYGAITTRYADKRGRDGSADGKQVFDFLIVVDFESTCWDKDDPDSSPPEIIEFPAILISASAEFSVLSEFREFVMPTERPRLSDFCKNLTGIAQTSVDDAAPISTCLVLFERWLEQMKKEHKFVVNDIRDGLKSATFVTWSDWDFNVCLSNECKRKQIRRPNCFAAWIDARAVYQKFYSRRPQGLEGALKDLGIEFEGRQHSGLCDARNTAKLLARMISDGCRMAVSGQARAALPARLRNAIPSDVEPAHEDTLKKLPTSAASTRAGPSVFKTPKNQSLSLKSSSTSATRRSTRRTSPLCKCGRRTKYCTVQKPGPNEGRSFYACPKGKQSGCKYFAWEDVAADNGASPVMTRTRLRVRATNAPSVNVDTITEEESLTLGRGKAGKGESSLQHNSTTSTSNPVPVVAEPPMLNPITKSASKPKKQYFGNVRIFNAPKCLR